MLRILVFSLLLVAMVLPAFAQSGPEAEDFKRLESVEPLERGQPATSDAGWVLVYSQAMRGGLSRISQPVASRAVCRELGVKIVEHFNSMPVHDGHSNKASMCMNTQTGEIFEVASMRWNQR